MTEPWWKKDYEDWDFGNLCAFGMCVSLVALALVLAVWGVMAWGFGWK